MPSSVYVSKDSIGFLIHAVYIYKMFFKKKGRKGNNLKQLVKEGNLPVLRSIIENDAESSLTTDDASGKTLLHLAVKYNKLELINFLLTSERIDINAQDSSGSTPVLMAFRDKHFEAAKILMDANARLLITNAKGKTAVTYFMRYCLSENIIPFHVALSFRDKLDDIFNIQTPESEMLAMYRSVSFEIILTLKSSYFMRMALISRNHISSSESRRLVIESMYSNYLNNLREVLTVGPDVTKRREIFRREFRLFIEGSHTNWKLALALVKKIMQWRLTGLLIGYFKKVFEKGNVKAIQMLLESGIVGHAKEIWDEDLTAHLFANDNKKVIQILRGRQFDVNARGENGRSGLHFAMKTRSTKNIRFLLRKGANINIKDDWGKSPMFEAENYNQLRLLISRGADVQVIDAIGFTAFEYDFVFALKQEMILGQLAIIEALGQPISQDILNKIQSKESFRKRYDKYRSYIERMKNYVICDNVTMFSILTKKPKNIVRYMRYKPKACKKRIDDFPLRYELIFHNTYYSSLLSGNAKFALLMCKLKNKAIQIVAESIGLFEADHLIIHRIVDFLSYKDLWIMFK